MREILTAPLLVVLLATLVAAGCGETIGEPTPTTAPTATVDAGAGTPAATPEVEIPKLIAPFELTTVEWPTEHAAAVAIINDMPETIADLTLEHRGGEADPDDLRIRYTAPEAADSLRLAVINLTTGDFFPPNWTPNDIVAYQIFSEDTREAGQDDEVVWSFVTTTENGVDLFGLLWGAAESATIFSAAATTEELLEELVIATVSAASEEETE
jgi:hypothetical protein